MIVTNLACIRRTQRTYREHSWLSSYLRCLKATWPPQRFQECLFFSFARVVPAQLLKIQRSKTQWREQK